MRPPAEQIHTILADHVFRWAVEQLPEGVTIDDVRYRDLVSVTEDDVYAHVVAHGFNSRRVVEAHRGESTDQGTVIERARFGRWRVYHTERGKRSDEATFRTLAAARREAIRRQMLSARIALNHRYRHAHPDEDLPLPSEMD